MKTAIIAETVLNEEKFLLLPLDKLHISDTPGQRHPKPNEVEELALSMKTNGQTTPAIVRPHPKRKGEYEIGAGARRKVAAESIGNRTLGCVVRNLNDDDFELLLLIENMQRENPDPREEVRLIERLVKRGVHTPEQISQHLGKSRHWAERRLGLLKVIEPIRKRWESTNGQHPVINHFTIDMVAFLGSLPADTQAAILKDGYFWRAKTRVELSKFVDQHILCRLDAAPFDLNDPKFFAKGCGPGCACDSRKQEALFDFELKTAGRCLNVPCFNSRLAKYQDSKMEEIIKEHGKLPVVSLEYCGYGETVRFGSHALKPERVYEAIAEKPRAGASKVLVYSAKNGTVKVGYLPKQSRGTSGKPAKSKPERLAERKNILQGKRWLIVHEELFEALKTSKHTQCTENVVDLVAVFGLPFSASHHAARREWPTFDRRKSKGFPANHATASGHFLKPREAALWENLKEIFVTTCALGGRVMDYGNAAPDMRRVAALIKFPIEERKRAADLTIIPPKSWGAVDIHSLEPVSLLSKAGNKLTSARAAQIKKKGGAK